MTGTAADLRPRWRFVQEKLNERSIIFGRHFTPTIQPCAKWTFQGPGKLHWTRNIASPCRQPSRGHASLISGAMAEINQLRRYLPGGAAFSLTVSLGVVILG